MDGYAFYDNDEGWTTPDNDEGWTTPDNEEDEDGEEEKTTAFTIHCPGLRPSSTVMIRQDSEQLPGQEVLPMSTIHAMLEPQKGLLALIMSEPLLPDYVTLPLPTIMLNERSTASLILLLQGILAHMRQHPGE